jgi:hypothetical protein
MLNSLYSLWSKNIEGDTHWGVEILDGKFKTTIIEISEVKIDEKDEAQLLADFHFINIPDTMTAEDLRTSEFDILMEDVICDLLERAMNDAKKDGYL